MTTNKWRRSSFLGITVILHFIGFAHSHLFWDDTCSNVNPYEKMFSNIDSMPFPCSEDVIPHYTCYRINKPLFIDGVLMDQAWKMAPKSERFRDLINYSETVYDTRAALLWDDRFLYVGYWVETPHVTASLTERDAPIYRDNDVELFIAGKDAYYELELNAFGTIYEVFFIWESSFRRAGYDQYAAFSRSLPGNKPFHGVRFKPHPRGPRIGYWSWDFPGLVYDVDIQGTINDSSDVDRGWTVELALPWEGMEMLALGDGRALPPEDGDVWRMDFSRFNQHKDESGGDSGGWAWSPHGVWDSHVPECFTFIHFVSISLEDK